ncbi:hypothetical protein B484DRAFT_21193 [Ochromonadaceae sp. CCMP2298]|nr:hypothetical protein B484DRAFT_21193 [Ochromonadaceae sp. CCMP2298]
MMLSKSWKGQQEEGRAWTEDINRPHETEVLYQGCKNFWRKGAMVDIILVAHKNYGLIEVVTYAPRMDREAPRLYLNEDILFSLQDADKCEESLREAKEILLRQRKVSDKDKLKAEILKESKINYILNHLSTGEFSLETRRFIVGFEFNFRDRIHDGVADKLLRERPRFMKRFVSPHYRSLVQGEIEACYNNIAADQAMILELRERAAAAEGRVNKVLTAMERWRLPMLYMKMMRGRFLGNKDAAIWSKVQKNFKDEDVMVAVKKALAEPLPPSLSTQSPSPLAGASAGMSTSTSTDDLAGELPSLGLKKKPSPSPSHGSPPGSRPTTPIGARGMSKGMGMGRGRPALSRAVMSSSSLAISPMSKARATGATGATGDGITKKPSLVKQKSVRAVPAESAPISGQVQEVSLPGGLFSVVGSIKRRLSALLSAPFSLPGSSKIPWDGSLIACEDPHSATLEHEARSKHESPPPSMTPTQNSVTGDSVPVRKADSFSGMVASLIGGLTIITAPLELSTARNPGAGAGTERSAPSTHSTAHGSTLKSTANKEPPTVTPSTTPSVTPTDHTHKDSAHTRDKKVPVHGKEGVTQGGEMRVKRMGRILAGMGLA